MQSLIELIKAVNVDKLKANGHWNSILEPGSLMDKLYNAIHEGKVKNNKEAAALIYPGQKGGAKLSNLIDRLKERLESVMFLLDFHASLNQSDRQKAYFECQRKWSIAMTLMTKNVRLAGIEVLEWVHKQSMFYEFTDLTLSTLSILRLHYGTTQNAPGVYRKYRDEYQEYQEIFNLENEVEDRYTELVSIYSSGKVSKENFVQLAEESYSRIAPYLKRYDSFKLHLSGRLMQLMLYSNKTDYRSTIKICKEAIAYFQSKPFVSYLPLQTFSYQMMVCYLKLGEFDNGNRIIQEYQDYFEEKSYNWYKMREIYFLLAMHTRHYNEAFKICEETMNVLKTGGQPEPIVEIWKIYNAYTYYLIHIGLIQPIDLKTAGFRMSKFLNETPMYSKDKQGMNVPIIIIHILFSIANPRMYHALDQFEAIEKYCNRYLRKSELLRSNYFIKALLQIPVNSVMRESAIKKTRKYLDLLKNQPVGLPNQRADLEVIPYEHLWEMVIESLKSPLRRQVPQINLKSAA
ncbi:MAG TPA: hypothetical protein VK168_19860 [Saprospiraceae bacterium]|nr:hypothetical protein [Saprospiraceae bacterium]